MHAFAFWQWSRCPALTVVMAVALGSLAPETLLAESRIFGWQWHGFATQGVVATDRNNFFGPSSDSASLQFTELGVNVSLRPWQDTLIAAQVISRRAGGESKDAQPALDYALIDRQVQANALGNWGIRAGRVKNPLGLYNETRDVAVTRPGILLPQSIYFDRTRSLGLSSDSVALYANHVVGSGDLRFKLNVGIPQTGEDVEWAALGRPEPGSFRGRTSVIGQLLYEHDGGRIIAAVGGGRRSGPVPLQPQGARQCGLPVSSLDILSAIQCGKLGSDRRIRTTISAFDGVGQPASRLQSDWRKRVFAIRISADTELDLASALRRALHGSQRPFRDPLRSEDRPPRAYTIREGLEHWSAVAGQSHAESGTGIPSRGWHGVAARGRQSRSNTDRTALGLVAWPGIPAFLKAEIL